MSLVQSFSPMRCLKLLFPLPRPLLSGAFLQVSFEQDVVLNQMNEYETLQLLMGDCRERLQAYAVNMEDDIKLNQQRVR